MTLPPEAPEGYTVVACGASPCRGPRTSKIQEVLSSCVQTSGHGLLVTAGCTLGGLACRSRPAGELVLLQPCDADRRPIGAAVMIGPLRTADDLVVLRDWILAGRFEAADLPARLTALHRSIRAAALN